MSDHTPTNDTPDPTMVLAVLERVRETVPFLRDLGEPVYRSALGRAIPFGNLSNASYFKEVREMLACHGVLGHPDTRAEEDAVYLELKSRGWGPTATAHTIVAGVNFGFLSS